MDNTIINAIRENPNITNEQLAQCTDKSISTIKRTLNKMRVNGIIELSIQKGGKGNPDKRTITILEGSLLEGSYKSWVRCQSAMGTVTEQDGSRERNKMGTVTGHITINNYKLTNNNNSKERKPKPTYVSCASDTGSAFGFLGNRFGYIRSNTLVRLNTEAGMTVRPDTLRAFMDKHTDSFEVDDTISNKTGYRFKVLCNLLRFQYKEFALKYEYSAFINKHKDEISIMYFAMLNNGMGDTISHDYAYMLGINLTKDRYVWLTDWTSTVASIPKNIPDDNLAYIRSLDNEEDRWKYLLWGLVNEWVHEEIMIDIGGDML